MNSSNLPATGTEDWVEGVAAFLACALRPAEDVSVTKTFDGIRDGILIGCAFKLLILNIDWLLR